MSLTDREQLIEDHGLTNLAELTDTPFVGRSDLRFLHNSAHDKAVRPSSISYPLAWRGMTLVDTLEWGSQTLTEVASLLGARVIDHKWGLIDRDDPRLYDGTRNRLPLRYAGSDQLALGAVVDIVKGRNPLDRDQLDAIEDLSGNMPQYDGLYWSDCYFGQFVNGTNSNGERALWLVDIDLKFSQYPRDTEFV